MRREVAQAGNERRPRREAREAREQPVAVAPADEVEALVAEEGARAGDGHDPGEGKVAVLRGQPGEEDGGLAFEERAEEHGEVAELREGFLRFRHGRADPRLEARSPPRFVPAYKSAGLSGSSFGSRSRGGKCPAMSSATRAMPAITAAS